MAENIRVPVLLGLCVLVMSCANVRYLENLEDYEREVKTLENRLVSEPDNVGALQRLGEIYVWTRHYGKANEYLQQAFAREPNDAKTHFYLGLAQETLGNTQPALRLYEKYADAPTLSPYRRLLQGRYRYLSRQIVRNEVKNLVSGEDTLAVDIRRVAVYPLRYQGTDDQYAALGRGFADLMTNDLARVPGIAVVERVRLQQLFDELKLAQSGVVDPSTAPRVGKILGAGRVAGGSYNVLNNTLDVDMALGETDNPVPVDTRQRSGALADFIQVEKDMVFDLIDQMGIELTPEQRERINFVPTRNLQAFLAYSQGLEAQDAGDYRRAAALFGRASRLDPTFTEARQQAEEMEALVVAAGTPEGLIGQLQVDPSDNLLGDRIQSLNGHIGSGLVPGIDARRPAPEAPQTLPDPPRPPAVQ